MDARNQIPALPIADETNHKTSLKRLVTAFLAGRAESTLRAYRQDLEDFRTFAEADTLDDAARLLLAHGHGEANALALAYRAHLAGQGLQATTVNRRLASLRSLVALAGTLGLVPWSLEIKNVKVQPYRDTRGPGRSGFRCLLDELSSRKDDKAIRDRAILRLLYDLGLRRGEVVSLDLEDLDLDKGVLAVRGKGEEQKTMLTVPDPTREALCCWVAARGDSPGPLFHNFDRARKGQGRLTGTGVYRIVRDLGDRAGIKVRPHGLRHTAITEALDLTNGNVRAVQRFSRHRDLRVVGIYDDNRQDLAGAVARLVAGSI